MTFTIHEQRERRVEMGSRKAFDWKGNGCGEEGRGGKRGERVECNGGDGWDHGEATNIVLQWTDYVFDKFDRLTEKTSKTSQHTDRQTDILGAPEHDVLWP